jgi:hypothetical protein
MPIRRKLLKIEDLADIMGIHHQIEDTSKHVIELLIFGFAYSSRYVLLKSNSSLEKLRDEEFRKEFCEHPSRFGSNLEFGKDLELDPDGTIYYIGDLGRVWGITNG